jgi:hypothetical protein
MMMVEKQLSPVLAFFGFRAAVARRRGGAAAGGCPWRPGRGSGGGLDFSGK